MLQWSTYDVMILVSTNQNYRRCVKKKKLTLEYTTPHIPQLNVVIKRIFEVIKEGALAMLLRKKSTDISQKMLLKEAVNTCKSVWNSMTVQAVWISWLKLFMERNWIFLVCSQSLDVSHMSLKRKILINKWRTRRTRPLWFCKKIWYFLPSPPCAMRFGMWTTEG